MNNSNYLVLRPVMPVPEGHGIEIVERKGLGHPDTLADAIAEEISVEYSAYCRNRYGAVLHHNVDKTAIIGGYFRSGFGYVDFVKPVTVLLNGRMSTSFGGELIDISSIQETAVRNYIHRILPDFDANAWLRFEHRTSDYSKYDTWFHPRSLEDLPEYQHPTASDTMVMVSHWPLTATEMLALSL